LEVLRQLIPGNRKRPRQSLDVPRQKIIFVSAMEKQLNELEKLVPELFQVRADADVLCP
jgi:hypothetical protein